MLSRRTAPSTPATLPAAPHQVKQHAARKGTSSEEEGDGPPPSSRCLPRDGGGDLLLNTRVQPATPTPPHETTYRPHSRHRLRLAPRTPTARSRPRGAASRPRLPTGPWTRPASPSPAGTAARRAQRGDARVTVACGVRWWRGMVAKAGMRPGGGADAGSCGPWTQRGGGHGKVLMRATAVTSTITSASQAKRTSMTGRLSECS